MEGAQQIAETTVRYIGAYLAQQQKRDRYKKWTKQQLITHAKHIGLEEVTSRQIHSMSKGRLITYLVDFEVNIEDIEDELERLGINFESFSGYITLPGITTQ